MVAEQRRMNGHHLHVHTLRVHILKTLLRGEAHLGRGDGAASSLTDNRLQTISCLVLYPVPGAASGDGLPQTLRHKVSMHVNTTHTVFLFLAVPAPAGVA